MRITFNGYAADSVISGEVELDFDRLKDLLDRSEELTVHNATRESLDDGREVCVPHLQLDRGEIVAAIASPPRGQHDRRIHTVRHRMLAEVGPYTVSGELHEKPGVAPMSGSHSARPMVSFTDASISYLRAGRTVRRRVDTLIVDRDHVLWLGADPTDPMDQRIEPARFVEI